MAFCLEKGHNIFRFTCSAYRSVEFDRAMTGQKVSEEMHGSQPVLEQVEYNQCQEAVKRLTDYLSKELRPEEAAQVERHLSECKGCFAKFRFEETLLRTIREKASSLRSPRALREKILGLISVTE